MKANELRGAIYARFKDLSAFAKRLGWSRQRLSYIVNGVREPNLSDIQEIATALDVDPIMVTSFFCSDRHKTVTSRQ